VFLAFFSIINIIVSVPITIVIYSLIVKIDYLSTLHTAALFILIVIGCDEILIFHEYWSNSFQIKILRNKPLHRLAYTIVQTSKATFITSIISSLSVFISGITDIMPIKAFSIFTGLIILICFL
jgi:hypothetical protein